MPAAIQAARIEIMLKSAPTQSDRFSDHDVVQIHHGKILSMR
jgi:hypothetical protein